MTDRLADLTGGRRYSNDSAPDLEAGLDDESARLLEKFNKEVAAIDKVIGWADRMISSDAEDESERTKQLDAVDEKMKAVRKRLKAMADANKVFARENSSRPATVRTRVVRYTKCSKDFIGMTERLSAAWDEHRQVLAAGVKRDVMRANPRASEREVDSALNSGGQAQLDAVLSSSRSAAAQHQLEDIRERNKDIQKLVKSVAELNQIFQDMSILVETQQDLINNIEYTVQDVKADVKVANEELVQARAHQKSKRKKKMCIIFLVIIIVIIILLAILIPVLRNLPRGNSSINVNVPSNNTGQALRMIVKSQQSLLQLQQEQNK